LAHIPSSDEYPTLNLFHAVSIVLYEIFQTRGRRPSRNPVSSEEERELLYEYFARLLAAIDYPDFRRKNTEIMFRRMMGRSVPTKWEFHTLMGVIGDAARLIEDGKERG